MDSESASDSEFRISSVMQMCESNQLTVNHDDKESKQDLDYEEKSYFFCTIWASTSFLLQQIIYTCVSLRQLSRLGGILFDDAKKKAKLVKTVTYDVSWILSAKCPKFFCKNPKVKSISMLEATFWSGMVDKNQGLIRNFKEDPTLKCKNEELTEEMNGFRDKLYSYYLYINFMWLIICTLAQNFSNDWTLNILSESRIDILIPLTPECEEFLSSGLSGTTFFADKTRKFSNILSQHNMDPIRAANSK